MQQTRFPAIHTAANARADAVSAEVAVLRAEADALLEAIDELCGEPFVPLGTVTRVPRPGRNVAA